MKIGKLLNLDIRILLALSLVLSLLLPLAFVTTPVQAASITSAATGAWNAGATWVDGVVPGATDSVVIASGHNVTVSVSATCAGVTINTGGTLSIANNIKLTTNGDVGGSGQLAPGGNASALELTGNWNFAGTYNNATRLGVTFSGAADQTIAGTAVATWRNITANKSGGTLFMSMTPTVSGGATTLTAGNISYNRAGGQSFLALSGTYPANVTLSGSGTKTMALATIVNGNLTIDNGVTLARAALALTLNGNFIKSGSETGTGAITIGGTATQSIAGFTTTGTVFMTKTGGTATLTGNVSGGAFTMSGNGGTLDLGTGLTHIFSGAWTRTNGTLNAGSSTLKIAGNASGTGGTFNAGTGTVEWNGGNQTVAVLNYYNLTLSGTGTKTLATGAVINGNLTQSGVTLSLASASTTTIIGDYTGTGALTLSGNLTIILGGNYAYTGTMSNASRLQLNLNGTGAQTVNGTHTFRSLTVNKGGGIATLGAAMIINNVGVTVTAGTLDLSTYAHTGAGTLTVSNGATLKIGETRSLPTFTTYTFGATSTVEYYGADQTVAAAARTYGNLTLSGSGVKTITNATINGTLSMAGTATTTGTAPAYGPAATLIYKGSGAQTTGIEFITPWTGSGGVKIENAGGVTLGAARTINSSLTMTSGKITTGANTLIIGAGGAISGGSSSSYVNGYLRKDFSPGSGQSFVFPIGDASAYTPVNLASLNVGTGGYLTVSVTGGDHPNIAASGLDATRSVNRYWTLASGGGLAATYNATFNYLSGDLDGGAVASAFAVQRYSSGAWSASTVSGTPTTTAVTITGEVGFGDFAVGNTHQPPVVSAVGLYQADRLTGVTAMTPQTEYAVKVTVSSDSTLASLSTVQVTIFYDADGIYAPGDVPLSGSTQTAAILTCTVGSTPSWSIDPGTNSTWSIVSASCVQPALTNTSGDFWFHFKPGKVATATTGGSSWHIYAGATGVHGAADNHQDSRTMNWYGEITVDTVSVAFGTITLGSDFSANSRTGISVTYICNGNYSQQVKASSPWSGGGNTVTLNTAGTPGEGEFSLKADDTAVLVNAVVVGTEYLTIGTGTQTGESGTTQNACTLWLKPGATGIPAVTYSGTIYYAITP